MLIQLNAAFLDYAKTIALSLVNGHLTGTKIGDVSGSSGILE